MAIVKYKNQSGVTYAYESTSVYDPVKKQSRPIRKYLGRVDPETGEIVSTAGKRGRPRKKPLEAESSAKTDPGTVDYKRLYEEKCRELEKTQRALEKATAELHRLSSCIIELPGLLDAIKKRIGETTVRH